MGSAWSDYFVPRVVSAVVTDEVSIVLGSTLSKVTVFGAVVVAMKMATIGQFGLAAAVLSPLLLAAYLIGTDGGLLA